MLDKYEKALVDLNKLLEIEPNDVSKDQHISYDEKIHILDKIGFRTIIKRNTFFKKKKIN